MKTINDHLNSPKPVPLSIAIDLVDRVAPLNLSESAVWFVNLVTARIADTGKHVDDLTVRELRQIINDCRTASNAAAKRKLYWWRNTSTRGDA